MDFWVETDAPLQGWGARSEKEMKEGRWTHEEGVLHITYNIRTSGKMFCIKLFFSRKSVQNIYVLKLTIQQLFYISMQWAVCNQSNYIIHGKEMKLVFPTKIVYFCSVYPRH